ncbi:DUF7010 family protein [Galbibacter pacificus]|uniref:Uncharacterized protein n=1 Tax=Galbibacter pacificus TaxID=2996052 RepID=A0ABT6FWI2_9FLAO|nr:hypothetical protein [Galbibacter pacificus]MDG3584115.1 hypothetical protein [Galbibacter pacificus]MDG3587452.1 hypothetical protein [Galbibacter pacificus]
MEKTQFKKLKREYQLANKNGIDFIISAGIIWFGFFIIWALDFKAFQKGICSFIWGAALTPLAIGISKILKTRWNVKKNPLQSLGPWLHFAQMIYFPILIFILLKSPQYFIMAYAVMIGANLFPYAWFYDEMGYFVSAILISVGAVIMALTVPVGKIYYIPLFAFLVFLIFAIRVYRNYKKISPQHN